MKVLARIVLATLCLSGCKDETEDCRAQLQKVNADFWGESGALEVERMGAFERLPQHDAPACVTEVLEDPKIDADQRLRFKQLAPLWRAAVADRNAAAEPEVDGEGLIRASPSADFYVEACSLNYEPACKRAELVQDVLDCSRGKGHACEGAAEGVQALSEFPQAFASPLVLLAKGCHSGSQGSCDALAAREDLGSLDPDFAASICDRQPAEGVCRRGLESKANAELAKTKLCDPLKVAEFCPPEEAQP
jgi:hypothetical protein